MRKIFVLLPFLLVAGTFLSPAFADRISTDKNTYTFGDVITISGKVSYEEGNFIGLQIISPLQSDIVVIDQFFPQGDGTFSKTYKAQGPKWSEEGSYLIKLVYNGQKLEKQFSFQKPEIPKEEPTPSLEPQQNSTKTPTINPPNPINEKLIHPKLQVNNFPDPEKSPNYYFDRYFSEPKYQEWFDEVFGNLSIFEVIGYKTTHVKGFPDNDNSPWYYVNRYNSEEQYRDWFDSQFPGKSIFEILDYPESMFQKVPHWIKNNAKWWSEGLIKDSEFLNGIEFLIKENIIYVSYDYYPNSVITQNVPMWIKDTAGWWADGLIDENEFLKGITFLIENKIIVV